MPDGSHTLARVRGEIRGEPALLCGPCSAATDGGAVAVEDVDPPGSGVVGVPALAGRARGGAEVRVVRRRARGVVVVVPRRRTCPALECTPGFLVALREFLGGAIR